MNVIARLSQETVEDIPSYMGSSFRDRLDAICETITGNYDVESAKATLHSGNSATINMVGNHISEIKEALEEFKDTNVITSYELEMPKDAAAA